MSKPESLHLVVTRTSGRPIADFVVEVDQDNDAALQDYLRQAVESDGWDLRRLPEFELDVRDPVTDRRIKTIRTGPED